MKKIKEFLLLEKFVNLLPANQEEKEQYKNEVYGILQKAYAEIGGLAGSGFKNPDDMVENIPFWKLARRGKNITAVVLYKDKTGRKDVAVATDGTAQGKKDLAMMFRENIKMGRSYAEMSGAALGFLRKNLPKGVDLQSVSMSYEDATSITKKPTRKPPKDDADVLKFPEVADKFYQRELGGSWKTKLMVGKIGNSIQ